MHNNSSYIMGDARANDFGRINGVVVTWVVAIDPPGVRFPLNASDLHRFVLETNVSTGMHQ